jgi:hypothetical protein
VTARKDNARWRVRTLTDPAGVEWQRKPPRGRTRDQRRHEAWLAGQLCRSGVTVLRALDLAHVVNGQAISSAAQSVADQILASGAVMATVDGWRCLNRARLEEEVLLVRGRLLLEKV